MPGPRLYEATQQKGNSHERIDTQAGRPWTAYWDHDDPRGASRQKSKGGVRTQKEAQRT